MPRLFVIASSALVALFFCLSIAASDGRLATEPLSVTRQDGRAFSFLAEIAATRAERETGLMGRTRLGPAEAMLFDFGEDRRVTMWMKNTLIPLDMLFADRTGVIVRIRENAEPQSLELIDSGGDVRFVLEIAGGTAARLGLAPGDRMSSDRIRAADVP